VHDSFEPSARGVVKSSWEFLRGLKALGTRTTERALPIGTPLTAIGQAVRGEDGVLQLRRPPSGRPFYVSTKTLEQLLDSLGAAARLFRALSLGCTAAGVALLLARAMQHLRAKRRAAALRRRVDAATAARRAAAAAVGGGGGAAGGTSDADDEAAQEVPALQLCVVRAAWGKVAAVCRPITAHAARRLPADLLGAAARRGVPKLRPPVHVPHLRRAADEGAYTTLRVRLYSPAYSSLLSRRAAQCPICRCTGPIIRVYRA
jgi:hypothetical protein